MQIRIAEEKDMANVYALRMEVFVGEQHVPPEIELDTHDACATHILAEEDGAVIGCARVLFSPTDAHIGRLAVKTDRRGCGVGAAICRFCTSLCRGRGIDSVWLNAQLHARAFYERIGFHAVGDTFFEAGIEHIRMEI